MKHIDQLLLIADRVAGNHITLKQGIQQVKDWEKANPRPVGVDTLDLVVACQYGTKRVFVNYLRRSVGVTS